MKLILETLLHSRIDVAPLVGAWIEMPVRRTACGY